MPELELRRQVKDGEPEIVKRSKNYTELKDLKKNLETAQEKEKHHYRYWITAAIPVNR